MIRYIKEWFPNPERDDLNLGIMNRKFEAPLEDHVLDCFLSIEETLDNVKMVNHEFIMDFDKISMTEYEQNRSKGKKKAQQNVVYVNESRLGELVMTFEVDVSEEPVVIEQPDKWAELLRSKMKDNAPEDPTVLRYTVKELVPIADEKDGSYMLKGKRYVPQYQLSETTTYNTSNQLVLKSIMGIKLEKRRIEAHDRKGDQYVMNAWRCNLMNGMSPVMVFYLSEYGWVDTLEFFMVGTMVEATEEETYDPNYTYFPINGPLSLKVKTTALTSMYVQGIVGSLLSVLDPKVTMADILSIDHWIAAVGATKKGVMKGSHFEMGRRYRILFKRMLDGGSKKSYRLTMHNKRTVLHAIRWMIQEYAILRARDNLDLSFKRLRGGNEYIAQLITGIISERIRVFVHTTANTPEKLKIKYDNLFKYKGMEVISKLHKSGLVKDEDVVNDMNDVYMRFAATSKGPNALGNNNQRNITMRQRGLHVSHIGKIGISECSSSDPGRTASICPLAETDGLFFKDTPPEPEEFGYNFVREFGGVTEWSTDDGSVILAITDPTKFNMILEAPDVIEIKKVAKP